MTEWEGPTCLICVSDKELRENSEDVIFEETTDENFLGLVNDINLQVKDTHLMLSRIYKN